MGHCRLLKIILWDSMTLLSNWRICLQGKDYHGESAWSSYLKGLIVSYKKLKNNNRTSDGFLYLILTYLSDLDLSLMETRKMIVYKTKSINNPNNRLLSFLAAQGSNEIHVVPSCATTDGHSVCCASGSTALGDSCLSIPASRVRAKFRALFHSWYLQMDPRLFFQYLLLNHLAPLSHQLLMNRILC